MSNHTKEQLKNVLINHGVSTPPLSAKKEEYIKLYDEYVAPVISNKGEFSSDDEPDTSNVADSGLIRNIIQNGTDGESGQLNGSADASNTVLDSLDDDELYKRLKDAGINCGPITATTRQFYQRKLADFLEPAGVTTPLPVSVGRNITENDEYSDNEDPEVILKQQSSVSAKSMNIPSQVPEDQEEFTAIRQRSRAKTEDTAVSHLIPPGRGPTPRPSIRNARGDLNKDYTPRINHRVESPVRIETRETLTVSPPVTRVEEKPQRKEMSINLYLWIMFILFIVGVLTLVLMYPGALEYLQALNESFYSKVSSLWKAESPEQPSEN
ncbi:lamina-associated polypeptide 2, isoforms beta/gamma-like [Artemia franciscana]|uniref:lamina-associated polypeptide 2, isoforms beta/gamma-like n=1 Tax=Artemia franciscana TaxID=6661 RepID=UPI0032DBCBDA